MQSRPTDNLQSIKTEPLNITTELSPRQHVKKLHARILPDIITQTGDEQSAASHQTAAR